MPKKPKKPTSLVQWEDIVTHTQKSQMIEAVLYEIAKLRKSPALKNLLDDSLRLFQEDSRVGTFQDLDYEGREYVMEKDGRISIVNGGYIKDSWLPKLIEEMNITPRDISAIRKEIEA